MDPVHWAWGGISPQTKGMEQLPGEAGGRVGLGRNRGAAVKGRGAGGRGYDQGFMEDRGTPRLPKGQRRKLGDTQALPCNYLRGAPPELEGCGRKHLTPARLAMAGAPPCTLALPAPRLRPSPTARGQTGPMGAERLPAAP